MTTIKKLHAEIEADWKSELGSGSLSQLRPTPLRPLAPPNPNEVPS